MGYGNHNWTGYKEPYDWSGNRIEKDDPQYPDYIDAMTYPVCSTCRNEKLVQTENCRTPSSTIPVGRLYRFTTWATRWPYNADLFLSRME